MTKENPVMNQRKSMSAAASASAMSDDAKSAEMLKQHEFAAGADPSEKKKANEALQLVAKALNHLDSACNNIDSASKAAPGDLRRELDVISRETGDKYQQLFNARVKLERIARG